MSVELGWSAAEAVLTATSTPDSGEPAAVTVAVTDPVPGVRLTVLVAPRVTAWAATAIPKPGPEATTS